MKWARQAGANGGTCGATWWLQQMDGKPTGWAVQHCGHPTALRPYVGLDPSGNMVLNGTVAFTNLKDAQAATVGVYIKTRDGWPDHV